MFASIRFFRRPIRWTPVEELNRLTRFVTEFAHIPELRRTMPNEEFRERSYETWVEMTTPLVATEGQSFVPLYELPPEPDIEDDESEDDDEADSEDVNDDPIVSAALDRCFASLEILVRDYRVSRRLSIRTFSPPRAPFLILAVFRSKLADYRNIAGFRLMHNTTSGEVTRYFGGPQLATPEDIEKLERDAAHLMQHPMVRSGELRIDALNAINVEGEFRGGVLLVHSASEIFLDATLALMLHEEGLTVDEAFIIFSRRSSLVGRVRREYASRLGGSWDTTAPDTPCALWYSNLVQLRNRIAHAAVLPRFDEARRALSAHDKFASFVRDRLAERVKRYPFTTAIVVTTPGMERRNKRGRAVDAAMATSTLGRIEAFNDWYDGLVARRESG